MVYIFTININFCLKMICIHFKLLGSMAWRSHGVDNNDLVNNLYKNNIIKSKHVMDVMKRVDRGSYCPNNPYMDAPQGIGFGQTISAPHMHAHCLELLKDHLKPGTRALDIGSGSGILTACMALMVGSSGKVVGIDHYDGLVKMSIENIIQDGKGSLIDSGTIILLAGDGRKGYPEEGPYNAIHVGAAAPRLPEDLVNQLAPGGRMIIPEGPEGGSQSLNQIDKSLDGEVTRTMLMGVNYVPLDDLRQRGRFAEF